MQNGKTYTVVTLDGHRLTGVCKFTGEDKVCLHYEGGVHMIYRRAIAETILRG